jgi:serine/threonine-protein kinase
VGEAAAGDVEVERPAVNLRRARVMLPVMIVVHVGWALAFTQVSTAPGGETIWRDHLIAIHGACAVVVGALTAIVYARGPLEAVRARSGELVTIYGLAFGAITAANTVHHQFAITAWVIASVLVSVAVYVRWPVVAIGYVGSAAVVLAAAFASTDETSVQLRQLSNVTTLGAVGLILSRILYASFVREVTARAALGAMNLELERRVAAQVGEIVDNAARIDALNRQLAGQVQARSEELATALGRLAAVEHGEDALRPGAVIGDRFEIAHLLGVGGMGVVYAAFDRVARGEVALKVVHERIAGVDAARRFLQEAQATASLSHPAIVRVLHVDVTGDGRLYQVQELIDGRTLDAWTDRERALPPPVVARLGAVLADALAAAHDAGVVHRDVKPQNVMLTREAPGCRLLDFGLAKLRRGGPIDSALTDAGTVVGTPQFLAPEQVTAPASVAGPADVYALGMVLYLAAAGRFPFEAAAPLAWMHAHAHVAPRAFGDAVPAPLADAVMACLAKEPAARPTARALADTLRAAAVALDAEPLERFTAREDQGETRQLVRPRSA